MVRRGWERGTKVTSGASVEFKKNKHALNLELRAVPHGKGQNGKVWRGGTDWVIGAKSEAKAVCLIQVERICV